MREVHTLVTRQRQPFENGRERRRIAAAQVQHGEAPALEARAQRPVQRDADFAVEHVVAGDNLGVGIPGVEKIFLWKRGHGIGSMSGRHGRRDSLSWLRETPHFLAGPGRGVISATGERARSRAILRDPRQRPPGSLATTQLEIVGDGRIFEQPFCDDFRRWRIWLRWSSHLEREFVHSATVLANPVVLG